MFIDDKKIMECVNIEETTKDKIVLNVNGEKIIEEIYEDNKIKIHETPEKILLYSGDVVLIEIYFDIILSKKECQQLAIEIINRLNNSMKTSLGIT